MFYGIQTPDYQVKFYRKGFYKIIRFDVPRLPHVVSERKPREDTDPTEKCSQALSRAKSVIQQVAICNDWEYFFTCTISKENFDRYDLDVFRVKFPQWIRDYNKKYGCKIVYLLVPEKHKDGAFHVHGFLSGIPVDHLSAFVPGIHPCNLVDGGFKNWGACSKKFGFCSLDPVRDVVKAGFYVCKYITKSLVKDFVGYGSHLYYCSLGLRRAVPLGYLFGGRTLCLDQYVNYSSAYCSTGYADESVWNYLWHMYDHVDEWFENPGNEYGSLPELITNSDFDFEQLCLFLAGSSNG